MKLNLIVVSSLMAHTLLINNAFSAESVDLPSITITGENDSAQPNKTDLEYSLSDVAGGTNLVDLDEAQTSKITLMDVLGNEPGVIMQEFFGGNDQPRLNIRGSGIQDNPVNRGVQLLYDGLAINQADGSFVIGLLPTEQIRYMSVYRGANALQYGGSSLGGAINMTSRTALNSNNFIRLQAGSFDTFNGSLGVGGSSGKWDYYLGADRSETEGYRSQSAGERKNLSLNTGYRNGHLENRTWFNYTDNHFQIPFVLQKSIAKNHPQSVIGDGYAGDYSPPSTLPAAAIAHPVYGWNARGGWDGLFDINKRDPHRDTEQFRLANKTYISSGNNEHEIGFYGEKMDDTFTDPLSHTVVAAKNIGLNYTLLNKSNYFTHEDQFLLSVSLNSGEMPTEYWVNNPDNGTQLFRFGDLDLNAHNASVGMQYTGSMTEKMQVVTGLQLLHNKRSMDGTGSTPPSPTSFDKVVVDIDRDFSYSAVNPKLGLIFRANDKVNIFSNISRSMEAPTFNQLVTRTVSPLIVAGSVSNPPTVPPFTDAAIGSGLAILDLKEQTAWTFELGSQGSWQKLAWNTSYYYSKVKDELITLVTDFAVNAETFNYSDNTSHQGVELGLDAELGNNVFRVGDELTAKLVYNYSDFKFDGGIYDGNQIAGIPEHLVYTELAYQIGKLYIAPNIRWQPSDTYVDHSNTQVQDAYVLLGLKAAYQSTKSLRFFADFNNIADKNYQTSYVIQGISAENQPTYLPGSGFSAMAGMEFTWE